LSGEWNDPALDRDLEQALAVEPSPEFLVRVRARVAAEPVRPTWSLGWPLRVAAVSVAGVAIVAVWLALPRDVPMPDGLPAAPVSAPDLDVTRADGALPDHGPESRTAHASTDPASDRRPPGAATGSRSVAANAPPADARAPSGRQEGGLGVFRRTIQFPEVQVSQDEVRTFRALVEVPTTQPAQVVLNAPPALPPDSAAPPPAASELQAVLIPPIRIEPVVLVAMYEGGGE
jgi:hypothetical protein